MSSSYKLTVLAKQVLKCTNGNSSESNAGFAWQSGHAMLRQTIQAAHLAILHQGPQHERRDDARMAATRPARRAVGGGVPRAVPPQRALAGQDACVAALQGGRRILQADSRRVPKSKFTCKIQILPSMSVEPSLNVAANVQTILQKAISTHDTEKGRHACMECQVSVSRFL